jgi:hypothetical protein
MDVECAGSISEVKSKTGKYAGAGREGRQGAVAAARGIRCDYRRNRDFSPLSRAMAEGVAPRFLNEVRVPPALPGWQ